jgi:hypothetical protein
VDRYLRLRAASKKLNHILLKEISRQAYDDIAEALGFLRDGVLTETHPAEPGTDEHYLLNRYLHAQYRVLIVESAAPGAGIACRDLLHNKEDLFVMDLGLSRSDPEGRAFATRTVPLGEYWMTTGAGLDAGAVTA